MTENNRCLLQLISGALNNNHQFPFLAQFTREDWETLWRTAEEQHLSAMIYELAAGSPSAQNMPEDIRRAWFSESTMIVLQQARQTAELYRICSLFRCHGIPYIVLKGITCRRLYPNPNARQSGDEDVLIDWHDYLKCDEILKREGYEAEEHFDPETVKEETEAHYQDSKGALYLEVHLNAIGLMNTRQERLNSCFQDSFSHVREIRIGEEKAAEAVAEREKDGQFLTVLEPTYQVMHLLSHFYRHFYENGAGIRQALDILLTLQKEKEKIDWDKMSDFLAQSETGNLFAVVLNVGRDSLNLDLDFIPKRFWNPQMNPEEMLQDMFEGGVYGRANGERKFGESLNLNIDTDRKRGLYILFPSKHRLQLRYPALCRNQWLYPVYVVRRWIDLFREYMLDKDSRELFRKRIASSRKRREMLERYRG